MPWSWRYEPDTSQHGSSSQEFPTQSDAETWIGETWRELLDGGVDAVLLLEEDRVVYGPMKLTPE
jgi:hypothetical protein